MSEPLFTTVEFDTAHDNIMLMTQTNGDKITITGISLGPNRAAALAYLVNQQKALAVEIKIKE